MLLYKSDCINGFIEYGKPWKQAFVAPGNKKLPIKSDEESSLVAGVRLELTYFIGTHQI